MAGMTAGLIGCAGRHGKGFAAGDRRLTCLVLGYDSIIYYTGTSKEMRDVNNGKVTDTVFMNSMFKKIKDGGLSLAIKPGGGADVLDNFQGVVNLSNLYEVERSVDSGDGAITAKDFGRAAAIYCFWRILICLCKFDLLIKEDRSSDGTILTLGEADWRDFTTTARLRCPPQHIQITNSDTAPKQTSGKSLHRSRVQSRL